MRMAKYILKRILLMMFVLTVIVTTCFILVRILPRTLPEGNLQQQQAVLQRWDQLGYNEPLLSQYFIYLKNIFTKWDFGTSWYIKYNTDAWELLTSRLLPTVLVNVYSLLFSTPVGILLGIYAAIRKNRWQDSVISTSVMIFVSVPSYVYAFLVQYIFYFKLGWLPLTVSSLADAGGSWLLDDVLLHDCSFPAPFWEGSSCLLRWGHLRLALPCAAEGSGAMRQSRRFPRCSARLRLASRLARHSGRRWSMSVSRMRGRSAEALPRRRSRCRQAHRLQRRSDLSSARSKDRAWRSW